MGLAEYVRARMKLTRDSITLQTDSIKFGSVELGSVYTLLSITTDVPCRLRIYDVIQSRDNVTERDRLFGNTNIADSIALVGDFSMSFAGTYTIDPILYGAVVPPANKLTYYRIDNVSTAPYPTIKFNRYLLEDSAQSIANRKNLPTITASLAANRLVSGTIFDPQIPRTYLLISASLSGSNSTARLRLYTTNDALSNLVEVSRSFAVEPANNSKLIVDMVLSSSITTYFIPKIVGANLQTMGTDLNAIRNNTDDIMGNNELYYILQNNASTGGTVPISASVHIFSLED
jgi:hypothetical protein